MPVRDPRRSCRHSLIQEFVFPALGLNGFFQRSASHPPVPVSPLLVPLLDSGRAVLGWLRILLSSGPPGSPSSPTIFPLALTLNTWPRLTPQNHMTASSSSSHKCSVHNSQTHMFVHSRHITSDHWSVSNYFVFNFYYLFIFY